jgi:hypothetical protein
MPVPRGLYGVYPRTDLKRACTRRPQSLERIALYTCKRAIVMTIITLRRTIRRTVDVIIIIIVLRCAGVQK